MSKFIHDMCEKFGLPHPEVIPYSGYKEDTGELYENVMVVKRGDFQPKDLAYENKHNDVKIQLRYKVAGCQWLHHQDKEKTVEECALFKVNAFVGGIHLGRIEVLFGDGIMGVDTGDSSTGNYIGCIIFLLLAGKIEEHLSSLSKKFLEAVFEFNIRKGVEVIGYEDVQKFIETYIEGHSTDKRFIRRHLLLSGPPGVGKSLVLKKLALKYNDDDEKLTLMVGSSTHELEWWFTVVDMLSRFCDVTSLVFLDEIDEFTMKRGNQREVYQMLRVMSGIMEMTNVVIIATTNRVDMLDEALLRAERFSPIIEFKLPNRQEREKIFKYFRDYYEADVSDKEITEYCRKTEGWSGADIRELIDELCLVGTPIPEQIEKYNDFKVKINTLGQELTVKKLSMYQ